MEPCIGIASRESGKGIEIQADVTLQLRQCCKNQVNTESFLCNSGSISFHNRNSQCAIFFKTGGLQRFLWVVCEELRAVGICDGPSRSLLSQPLPSSLGLKPIIS